MRGEQVQLNLTSAEGRGSPPLARGTVYSFSPSATNRGITPACAGNSRVHPNRPISRWDHPRLRGEQCLCRIKPRTTSGSPPLARGTASAKSIVFTTNRITPACAGNRFSWPSCGPRERDHPRLRGEQPVKSLFGAQGGGSPPLARGTVAPYPFFKVGAGITPACAGNSRLPEPCRRQW